MKNFNEEFKIKLFNELADVLKSSSFEKDEPIPIASVFYDIDTLEILCLFKNESTIGMKKENKYLKHGEHLAVTSSFFDDALKNKNIGVLITIPPCEDCYKDLAATSYIKQINWVTHRNGEHKIHKILKLIKNDIRDIPFEKLRMRTEEEKIAYNNVKREIKKVELWMKNS